MSLPNLRVFIKYAETIKKVDTSIAKYSFPLSKEIFSKIPFSREINITKQHLWFVKDGSVVLESDFVSGKESDPTRLTPSGTYYIYNKERNRVLRGTKQPNGKYEYESPVSYWMPFNKGIGLHDASWRSTFGRDIYINSGSHGCINLPTGFAGSLYSQIYVNLPVVVYR